MRPMRHFISRILGAIVGGGAGIALPENIEPDLATAVVILIYAIVHRLSEKFIDPEDQASSSASGAGGKKS